jgi:hypothetical protein
VKVHRKLLDGWPIPNGRLEDKSVSSLLSMSRQTAFQETKAYPDNELVQQRWKKVQEVDPDATVEILERLKQSAVPRLFE